MKVIEFIEQARQRFTDAGLFFGHGTTNAFDEAVWLTLWVLKEPLDDLESHAERILTPEQVLSLNALVEQRITTRKPVAYLTQEAWLQGVPFYVDERSIIPRSLIAEVLTEGTVDAWLERAVLARGDTVPRIMDLCTGNGSLAVIAAITWPDALVCATDIDADALAVARINVEQHQLERRITLLQSNGLETPELKQKIPFDVILCNPPYVNAQSMRSLPAEYLVEPELALAGGVDGMDFIRPMLAQVAGFLSDEGFLVLEIGNERAYFETAFPHLNALWLETSAGEDQVLLLTREALSQTS